MRWPGFKRDVFANNAGSSWLAMLPRTASHLSSASSVGTGSVRASFCILGQI
jgi:hypothetical protein